MDRMPFYGERGPIPFFLGRKSSVCKKRLWTKWFCILSQPLFAYNDKLRQEFVFFVRLCVTHGKVASRYWPIFSPIDFLAR